MTLLGPVSGPEPKAANVLLVCPVCRKPSTAILHAGHDLLRQQLPRRAGSTQDWVQAGYDAFGDFPNEGDPANQGWKIAEFWPAVPVPAVPEFLPDPVARAFRQGEATYNTVGLEETAAGAYGRALEVGTKMMAPDFSGTLFKRIQHLAETGKITADLAMWAHDIRSIRNDALHEVDGISREELTHVRGLADMVLRYLFTLPGMLAARKAEGGPLA